MASFDIKGIKKNFEFFFLVDNLSIVALVDIIKSYNLLDPLGPLKVGKKLIFFFELRDVVLFWKLDFFRKMLITSKPLGQFSSKGSHFFCLEVLKNPYFTNQALK